jgi:hypothetical protein
VGKNAGNSLRIVVVRRGGREIDTADEQTAGSGCGKPMAIQKEDPWTKRN